MIALGVVIEVPEPVALEPVHAHHVVIRESLGLVRHELLGTHIVPRAQLPPLSQRRTRAQHRHCAGDQRLKTEDSEP
jgi:hypothetical protein